MAEEVVATTNMRTPVDVNERIKVLAALEGISIQEWNHRHLRKLVDRMYRAAMDREARKNELGNPVG